MSACRLGKSLAYLHNTINDFSNSINPQEPSCVDAMISIADLLLQGLLIDRNTVPDISPTPDNRFPKSTLFVMADREGLVTVLHLSRGAGSSNCSASV